MKTMRHMKMSIRGCLMNWSDDEMRGVFSDSDGADLSPYEARKMLLDELAKGHEVIPVGNECEGFDYSGSGCPGHPMPDEDSD